MIHFSTELTAELNTIHATAALVVAPKVAEAEALYKKAKSLKRKADTFKGSIVDPIRLDLLWQSAKLTNESNRLLTEAQQYIDRQIWG